MQHPRKQTARTLALLVERRGGVPVGVTVTGTQNQTATGGLLCRLCPRFEATNAQQPLHIGWAATRMALCWKLSSTRLNCVRLDITGMTQASSVAWTPRRPLGRFKPAAAWEATGQAISDQEIPGRARRIAGDPDSRFPAESGFGDSLFPGQIGDSLPDSRPNRESGERELGISGSGPDPQARVRTHSLFLT